MTQAMPAAATHTRQTALAALGTRVARVGADLARRLPEPVRRHLGLRAQGTTAELLLTHECQAYALWSSQLLALGVAGSQRGIAHDVSQPCPSADTLAAAVLALAAELPNYETPPKRCIMFLPAEEFMSTVVSLPGLAPSAAAQAITLQAESLVPSLDDRLALIQTPTRLPGTDDYLCLWMRHSRLDEYSAAFESAGLELVALAPRALLAKQAAERSLHLLDQDASQTTRVILQDGLPIKWETIQNSDLADTELLSQWQTEQKANELANAGRVQLQDSPDWLTTAAANAAVTQALNSGFMLLPNGELNRRRTQTLVQRLAVAAVVVALLMLVALVPFALQSVKFRFAANELLSLREQASAARQDQAFVAEFDRRWGAVNDYPQQAIVDTMFTLQSLIAPDTLTSLEVDEGLISIEGTSNNPQAILQRLEQDPLFTEVVFSRATNNSRYYIDLRLSTVSFEGYRVRHLDEGR